MTQTLQERYGRKAARFFPSGWLAAGLALLGVLASASPTAHGASSEAQVRQGNQPPSDQRSPVLLPARNSPGTFEPGPEWNDLRPLLAEAAGAMVLEELLLTRALKNEAATRGLTVGPSEISAERELLRRTLSQATSSGPDEGERLIEALRRSRGLGEARFAALLERNAFMRAIVRDNARRGSARPAGSSDSASVLADDVDAARALTVSDDDLTLAYDIRYGPRVKARLILVRTAADAAAALKRLGVQPAMPGAEDDGVQVGVETFAHIASEVSIDGSRVRGGTLDAISPSDPAYPEAVRTVLRKLKPGEVHRGISVAWGSGAGATGAPGIAIFRVDERLESSGPSFSQVSAALREEIVMVRERALMEKLARQLIADVAKGMVITDPALDWSWRQRPSQ